MYLCHTVLSDLQEHGVHPEGLLGLLSRRGLGVNLAEAWGERRPVRADSSSIGARSASPSVLLGDVARVAERQAEAHEGQPPCSSQTTRLLGLPVPSARARVEAPLRFYSILSLNWCCNSLGGGSS